jgi:hypothetical protein
MKIEFEDWFMNERIPFDAQELMRESILSYKASAYRSSLLFSFLAFQAVVKHRILHSEAPEDYTPGEWQQIQRDVSNDDIWDKQIILQIQKKNKGSGAKMESIYLFQMDVIFAPEPSKSNL